MRNAQLSPKYSAAPSPLGAGSRVLYLVPARQHPRARNVPEGRTLHLLDLENLVGGPLQPPGLIGVVSEMYRDTGLLVPNDHVVVSTNPHLALHAGDAWPGAQFLVGFGRDGADRALINSVRDHLWVASHYDRVIVGSGDGIFSETALALRALGLAVGIVARRGGLARKLAVAADFVRLLPQLSISGVAA